MSLTNFDVANLNNAIAGVGNTFAEGRREDLANRKMDIEEDFRQKMLDAEMRRMTAEEGRQNLLEQPKVSAFLADPDTMDSENPSGMTVQGTYDQVMHIAGQSKNPAGKPMTILPQHPGNAPVYGHVQVGGVTLVAHSKKEYDQTMATLKAQGVDPLQTKNASTYGPVAADKAAADLESQADLLEQMQTSGPGQFDQHTQDQIDSLRERSKFLRAKPASQDSLDLILENGPIDLSGKPSWTRRHYISPGSPWPPPQASSAAPVAAPPGAKQKPIFSRILDAFGGKSSPGASAAPPADATTLAPGFRIYLDPQGQRVKIPNGVTIPPHYTPEPPAAPQDPTKRQAGQKYSTPKGVYTWTGTAWSADADAVTSPQIFTDKTGKNFRYTGTMAEPLQDQDTNHWQQIQQ